MRHLFLSIAIAAILAFSPAFAADEAKPTQLQGVTVSASKAPRSAFDVPAAVTVITAEDIDRVQANNWDDALRQIPNFDSAGGPRRISQEPSIRGLSDRRIVIKVDGMRRNFRAQLWWPLLCRSRFNSTC